jgi:hypothetical protein
MYWRMQSSLASIKAIPEELTDKAYVLIEHVTNRAACEGSGFTRAPVTFGARGV